MMAKSSQAGSPGETTSGSSGTSKKSAAADRSYDTSASDTGTSPATDLEAKQQALADLVAQQKQLVAEISDLRTFQTDLASFDSQIKSGGDAIERDRKDLQTFTTNELKALDTKTRSAIAAVVSEVDTAIAKARSDYEDAVKRTKIASDAVERSEEDLAKATTTYAKTKQAVAEAKRVLGELKSAKKEVQAAEGRNEFLVSGYWVLEMDRRLPELHLPDAAALTKAFEEFGKKRKSADDAKREADAAKADETTRRKARDDAEKSREGQILEALKSQSEAQKPETAA